MMPLAAFAVLFLVAAVAPIVSAKPQQQTDIREFVRSHLFPRSYSELRAAFDASVTPDLLAMLNSKAEEEHWLRIAGMLGAVGDERAAEGLIEFVEEPGDARLSQWHHDGRTEAIRALGFLTYRTGSERALTYLIDSLTSGVWRERKVMGLAPGRKSYAEYDSLLSTYAIIGLAWSGHPRAKEALMSVLRSPTPEQRPFRDEHEATPEHWLEVHALVAELGYDGLKEHYELKRLREHYRHLKENVRKRKAEFEKKQRALEAEGRLWEAKSARARSAIEIERMDACERELAEAIRELEEQQARQ